MFFHTTLFENFMLKGVSVAATKNQPVQQCFFSGPQTGKSGLEFWKKSSQFFRSQNFCKQNWKNLDGL